MHRLLVPALLINAALLAVRVAQEEKAPVAAQSLATVNGDANGDGERDLADAVHLLTWLFSGGPEPVALAQEGYATSAELNTVREQVEALESASAVVEGTLAGLEGRIAPLEGNTVAIGRRVDCIPGQGAGRRFVDNGDGTVSDTCTGLTWQKRTADINGDGVIGVGDTPSLADAELYLSALILGGFSDWRLPTIQELRGLVDPSRFQPATDPAFDTLKIIPEGMVGGVCYRSSTPYLCCVHGTGVFPGMNFETVGGVCNYFDDGRSPFVLAVRG